MSGLLGLLSSAVFSTIASIGPAEVQPAQPASSDAASQTSEDEAAPEGVKREAHTVAGRLVHPGPQDDFDKLGPWGNGDVTGEITDTGLEVNVRPAGTQPDTTSTTVTIQDSAGDAGEASVESLEAGDTVNVQGSKGHQLTISGSGGTINLNNPDAGGTITNANGPDAQPITVLAPGHRTMSEKVVHPGDPPLTFPWP